MSVDLKDGRYKPTALTSVYLEAERRATGDDKSKITREIMHAWAQRKHTAAIEAQKLLEAEGIAGIEREDAGIVGNNR